MASDADKALALLVRGALTPCLLSDPAPGTAASVIREGGVHVEPPPPGVSHAEPPPPRRCAAAQDLSDPSPGPSAAWPGLASASDDGLGPRLALARRARADLAALAPASLTVGLGEAVTLALEAGRARESELERQLWHLKRGEPGAGQPGPRHFASDAGAEGGVDGYRAWRGADASRVAGHLARLRRLRRVGHASVGWARWRVAVGVEGADFLPSPDRVERLTGSMGDFASAPVASATAAAAGCLTGVGGPGRRRRGVALAVAGPRAPAPIVAVRVAVIGDGASSSMSAWAATWAYAPEAAPLPLGAGPPGGWTESTLSPEAADGRRHPRWAGAGGGANGDGPAAPLAVWEFWAPQGARVRIEASAAHARWAEGAADDADGASAPVGSCFGGRRAAAARAAARDRADAAAALGIGGRAGPTGSATTALADSSGLPPSAATPLGRAALWLGGSSDSCYPSATNSPPLAWLEPHHRSRRLPLVATDMGTAPVDDSERGGRDTNPFRDPCPTCRLLVEAATEPAPAAAGGGGVSSSSALTAALGVPGPTDSYVARAHAIGVALRLLWPAASSASGDGPVASSLPSARTRATGRAAAAEAAAVAALLPRLGGSERARGERETGGVPDPGPWAAPDGAAAILVAAAAADAHRAPTVAPAAPPAATLWCLLRAAEAEGIRSATVAALATEEATRVALGWPGLDPPPQGPPGLTPSPPCDVPDQGTDGSQALPAPPRGEEGRDPPLHPARLALAVSLASDASRRASNGGLVALEAGRLSDTVGPLLLAGSSRALATAWARLPGREATLTGPGSSSSASAASAVLGALCDLRGLGLILGATLVPARDGGGARRGGRADEWERVVGAGADDASARYHSSDADHGPTPPSGPGFSEEAAALARLLGRAAAREALGWLHSGRGSGPGGSGDAADTAFEAVAAAIDRARRALDADAAALVSLVDRLPALAGGGGGGGGTVGPPAPALAAAAAARLGVLGAALARAVSVSPRASLAPGRTTPPRWSPAFAGALAALLSLERDMRRRGMAPRWIAEPGVAAAEAHAGRDADPGAPWRSTRGAGWAGAALFGPSGAAGSLEARATEATEAMSSYAANALRGEDWRPMVPSGGGVGAGAPARRHEANDNSVDSISVSEASLDEDDDGPVVPPSPSAPVAAARVPTQAAEWAPLAPDRRAHV